MGGYFSRENDGKVEEFAEVKRLSGFKYWSRFGDRRHTLGDSGQFEVSRDMTGIEGLKNYGILPVGTLINIFEMLNLNELLECSCSCKLFRSVIQTSIFWKLYLENITGRKYSRNETLDWKYEVFKTFYSFGAKNEYYRKLFFDAVSSKWKDTKKNKKFVSFQNGGLSERSYNNNSYAFDMLIKFLLIGDAGVGKTSLMIRKSEHQFQTNYITTIGVEFKIEKAMYQDTQIKYQVWDTAGQERFRTITASYYKGANAILICFSIDRIQSFNNVKDWYREVKSYASVDCQVVFVGCKCDLEKERQVSSEEVEKFLRGIGMDYSTDYCECSSKENLYIDLPFGMAMDKCLTLTEKYFSRKELENITKIE